MIEPQLVVRNSCVRSGFCCQQSPCPFGTWDEEAHQCAFLEGDAPGEYRCGKYHEILALPPERGADIAPAFGTGCCSSMNPVRVQLLRERR